MRICLVAVLVALLSGSLAWTDEKVASRIDKRAFERARKAAVAENWDTAIAILDKIDVDQIEDLEVIEYVVFSKLCTKTAAVMEVNRKVNVGFPIDVVVKVDWNTLIATLSEKTFENTTTLRIALLKGTQKIQKALPRYQALDHKLAVRYAIGNSGEGLFDATFQRTVDDVRAAQDAVAKRLDQKVFEKNSIGMELVLIPPGKFLMGSPESDPTAEKSEKPQVEVAISRPFYVGRTEVTQGQWKQVMQSEPWKSQSFFKEGSEYPATYVSWQNAQDFCGKLGAKEGKVYRMLTEPEWEYACRAGTTTRYYFGDGDADLGKYA